MKKIIDFILKVRLKFDFFARKKLKRKYHDTLEKLIPIYENELVYQDGDSLMFGKKDNPIIFKLDPLTIATCFKMDDGEDEIDIMIKRFALAISDVYKDMSTIKELFVPIILSMYAFGSEKIIEDVLYLFNHGKVTDNEFAE